MKGQLKVISNRGWFKKENERYFMENSLLKWPLQSLLWICSMMSLRTESIEQLKLAFIGFRQQSSETNYV
jgi:hypothetical protein